AVYGQPLVAGGRVIVATEEDNIYALDPHDGSVIWQVNIGTPLRDVRAQVGCGNVDPLGITGTPVADTAAGVVYAVGEVSTGGRAPVSHQMVAVDIRTGRLLERVGVDPPLPAGESPLNLLQRAALALGNGRVYVGYGGHFGDCGTYHGWLVSVPSALRPGTGSATGTGSEGGTAGETAFNVTPSSTGGAVWGSGAAPALGADGSVYVTTGNPNSAGPSPWAEAVVKLAPGLGPSPEVVFQDRQATGDLDLSTGGPVLLPGGELFAVGKTDTGYRLRQSDLLPLPAVRGTVCGSDPDGGSAFDAALDTLYVPCRGGGIQEIGLGRNRTGWRSGSANSTPILAGGSLWALAYPAGTLQQLDPATGRVLSSTAVGRPVPTFASPSAASGLLLVPTRRGVVAYSGPAGPPASARG
ncbi:MAG TPA: PQQ-binding-like beta-propeller repeat protein, partial [Acidimicrobiales bacterium]|nr:PQQ-binding-like beta-propeller repeat protein [Acidimicrobiales bacterium]